MKKHTFIGTAKDFPTQILDKLTYINSRSLFHVLWTVHKKHNVIFIDGRFKLPCKANIGIRKYLKTTTFIRSHGTCGIHK